MKFWVDYSATVMIEADNEEEAKKKFYLTYMIEQDMIAEVTNFEKVEEDE